MSCPPEVSRSSFRSGGRGMMRSLRGNCRAWAFWLSPALICWTFVSDHAQAGLTAVTIVNSAASQPADIVPARAATLNVSPAALPVPAGEPRGVITYGDRLKITFFENLDVALNQSPAGSDAGVATLFPRMDLTGEYSVDDGGGVNIPRLGQVAITGLTLPALRTQLETAFRRVVGRPCDVHIAIVERQPVYVMGAVRAAGAFRHTPGMIVLQALADAGGIDRGGADTSRAIESLRETERLRQTVRKLNHLLVRQARLVAQQGDSTTIALPASTRSRLEETASTDELNALVAAEAASLTAEHDSYQRQLLLSERQLNISRIEIEAHKKRADQIELLTAMKAHRLQELKAVAGRGNLPEYTLTNMSVDISDLVVRRVDQEVELAQAERRKVEAEIVLAKIQFDHFGGLEKELAATVQDIDDCTGAIASMQGVVQLLRKGLPETEDSSATVSSLKITRRGPDGLKVIYGTETTPLEPGDVVQVNSPDRADGTSSRGTQAMGRSQL